MRRRRPARGWRGAVTDRPQWETRVRVEAPLVQVWDAVEDLSLIPEYHPEVRNVQFLSGDVRRRQGVRYKCVIPRGRKGWCVEEVVAHEPLARTTVAFTEDSWGMARRLRDFVTEISVEPEGSAATQLRLRAWYRPSGLGARLANPVFLRRAMRRRADATLRGLKALVERRAQHAEVIRS